MNQAWMWYDDDYNGTLGAKIDLEKERVSWFFEAGCACTDSESEQSLSDFIANGPSFVMPPVDILAEMRELLTEFA